MRWTAVRSPPRPSFCASVPVRDLSLHLLHHHGIPLRGDGVVHQGLVEHFLLTLEIVIRGVHARGAADAVDEAHGFTSRSLAARLADSALWPASGATLLDLPCASPFVGKSTWSSNNTRFSLETNDVIAHNSGVMAHNSPGTLVGVVAEENDEGSETS